MSNVKHALAIFVIGAFLASCANRVGVEPGKMVDAAHITLTPGSYGQLAGWSDDSVAAAVPAFLRSCDRLAKQLPDSTPLDPSARGADFGRLRDWRPLCRAAAKLPAGDEAAARQFFEENFLP